MGRAPPPERPAARAVADPQTGFGGVAEGEGISLPFSFHRIEFFACEIFHARSSPAAIRRLLEAARREGGAPFAEAVAARAQAAIRSGKPPVLPGRASSRWRRTAFADAGAVARHEAGGRRFT